MRTLTYLSFPIFIFLTGCASISTTLSENTTDDYDFREQRQSEAQFTDLSLYEKMLLGILQRKRSY